MISVGGILAKRCSRCGVTKELEKFHASKASQDGLTPHCAECASRRTRRNR